MSRGRIAALRIGLWLVRRSGTLRRSSELADVIAYLERRARNCERMMTQNPVEADRARIMRRQIEVLIGDLRAGLHHGESDVAALLAASDADREAA